MVLQMNNYFAIISVIFVPTNSSPFNMAGCLPCCLYKVHTTTLSSLLKRGIFTAPGI